MIRRDQTSSLGEILGAVAECNQTIARYLNNVSIDSGESNTIGVGFACEDIVGSRSGL